MSLYCWIATAICLSGTVINVKRVDWCFLLWAAGETMWLWYDARAGVVSRSILDAVGLALAVWGAWENLVLKHRRKNNNTTKKENAK